MSLKAVPIWICANHFPQHSQLGSASDLVVPKRCRFVGYSRMECFGSLSAQRAKTPVEDDKPLTKPDLGAASVHPTATQNPQSIAFHKDLNSLPSELDFHPLLEFFVFFWLLNCDFYNAWWDFGCAIRFLI